MNKGFGTTAGLDVNPDANIPRCACYPVLMYMMVCCSSIFMLNLIDEFQVKQVLLIALDIQTDLVYIYII